MNKRPFKGRSSTDEPPPKRKKAVYDPPTSEEIYTSRQLKKLLTFDQDQPKARHAIHSFKLLLERTLPGQGNQGASLSLLKEYLESTKPRDGAENEEEVWLADIMETWNYAASVNNEALMSEVPPLLTLLLQATSENLDLLSYGTGICNTILQERQQRILGKTFAADRHEDFMILPAMRLVKEIICFDGGALANSVYRARQTMLKFLGRHMNTRNQKAEDERTKDRTLRSETIMVFLSALKYTNVEAKKELLAHKDVALALSRSLVYDGPKLLLEVFDVLKNHVILDKKIPWESKNKFFGLHLLRSISGLYGYEQAIPASSGQTPVDEVAHSFLMTACTSPHSGILWMQTGFYPRGVDETVNSSTRPGHPSKMSLCDIAWLENYQNEISVRNVVLSDFIQGLRPWQNLKHAELILAIFAAVPELVARYFIQRRSFTFEPKLTATWIGYAAFLYSTIQLPIPPHFGQKSEAFSFPPPPSILLDNILPQPLNQRALTRCLSQQSKLVSFFSVRILVIAMQKLSDAITLLREARPLNEGLWDAASRKLLDEFCQRIPGMHHVINNYRGVGEDDLLHREAVSRLLRLYYEVTPQTALVANFDVSPLIVSAIQRLGAKDQVSEDYALRSIELENLLAIAGYSPGMRWFSKTEGLTLSPFTALIRVYVEAPEGVSLENLREILNLVAEEQQIVRSQSEMPGLTALLSSLRYIKGLISPSASEGLWTFLDNCVSRCATTPIKYIDMLQEILERETGDEPTVSASSSASPILITIMEQLPFALGPSSDETAQILLARFLAVYLGFCGSVGEDSMLLDKVLSSMIAIFSNVDAELKLVVPAGLSIPSIGRSKAPRTHQEDGIPINSQLGSGTALNGPVLADLAAALTSGDPDNSALIKWTSKPVDDLIDEGYASALVKLLSSEHTSIRKEALVNVLKMAAKFQESTYEEKEQVWLLLSELAESSKGNVDNHALPSSITAFACHALEVLKNPLHSLYEKVNLFLTRGPLWQLDRLPLVHEVLDEDPADSNSYYQELTWLLTYLLDSLRTSSDLALFHHKKLFERILSLASQPYMRRTMKNHVLRILYRATCIRGGSDTLVTRFGIVSWLQAQEATSGAESEAAVYKALVQRIWDTCDQERAMEWSKTGMRYVVEV